MKMSIISESCYTNHITHIVLILEHRFTVNTPPLQTHTGLMDYVDLNSIHTNEYQVIVLSYIIQSD